MFRIYLIIVEVEQYGLRLVIFKKTQHINESELVEKALIAPDQYTCILVEIFRIIHDFAS